MGAQLMDHPDVAPASGQLPQCTEPVSGIGARPSTHQHLTRVLLVDDEAPARKLLTLILGSPNFHCSTASNGEEALAALQQERFDAVISDLTMPGLGGMEVLDQVRPRYPYMVFLVTTGVDDVEIGVKAMRRGADDYLIKPLYESAVLASLERALHQHRLEQEAERYRVHLEDTVEERTGEVKSALKQIERTYEDTLQALGAAIDLRDNETAGHSQRVCLFSTHIARAMGWPDEQLRNLARGACLHDIGKLGIPDSILLKPGPLDAEQRKIMQRHAQMGFDLIKDIPFLSSAAEIVLTHHERYDGLGYPRGLKGEEVPAGARIFAIADTLDTMTSERPYRNPSSFEEAHNTIRELSGNQCDPEVVNVFLRIPKDTWEKLATNQRTGRLTFRL
jgi:response regulator RpfG family c-di-GMP phosphodiesterase